MKCKCEKCGAVFEATGGHAFGVLTGGIECPGCGGNVNVIIADKKR